MTTAHACFTRFILSPKSAAASSQAVPVGSPLSGAFPDFLRFSGLWGVVQRDVPRGNQRDCGLGQMSDLFGLPQFRQNPFRFARMLTEVGKVDGTAWNTQPFTCHKTTAAGEDLSLPKDNGNKLAVRLMDSVNVPISASRSELYLSLDEIPAPDQVESGLATLRRNRRRVISRFAFFGCDHAVLQGNGKMQVNTQSRSLAAAARRGQDVTIASPGDDGSGRAHGYVLLPLTTVRWCVTTRAFGEAGGP